ncbi:MAG TPA: membrane protein insertase YidC, partial [Phycisphaerae bacterium]|nr:membrane protein insertase YidC [Phycisphaerae bacterium]
LWSILIFSVIVLAGGEGNLASAKGAKGDWNGTDIDKNLRSTVTLGSTDPENGTLIVVDIQNKGAGVSSLKLTDPSLAGNNELFRTIDHRKKQFLPFATRTLLIRCDDKFDVTIPLSDFHWEIADSNSESVSYVFTLTRNNERIIKLTKTYKLAVNDYSLLIDLKIENLYSEDLMIAIDQAGPTGMLPIADVTAVPEAIWGKFDSASKSIEVKSEPDTNKLFVNRATNKIMNVGISDAQSPALWIGQEYGNFHSILSFDASLNSSVPKKAKALFYHMPLATDDKGGRTHGTGIWLGVTKSKERKPVLTLEPGTSKRFSFNAFAGPRDFVKVRNSDHADFYKENGYFSLGKLTGSSIPASESSKHYIGSVSTKSGFKGQLEAVNRGGSLYTVKLSEFQSTVKDKNLADEDPDAYQQEWRKRKDEGFKGPYSLLNPLHNEDDSANVEYLSMSTGKIFIRCEGENWVKKHDMSKDLWKKLDSEKDPEGKWEIIRFENVLKCGSHDIVKVTKTFKIEKDSYSFDMTIKIENLYDADLLVYFEQAGPNGVPREDYRSDLRQVVAGQQLKDDKKIDAIRKKIVFKKMKETPLGRIESVGRSDDAEPVVWFGSSNKFFACLMYPKPQKNEDESTLISSKYQAEYFIIPAEENYESRVYATMIRIGETDDKPQIKLPKGGEPFELTFDVFTGAKKRDIIKNDTDYPLYARLNYIKSIDTDRSCCSFMVIDSLAFGMMWLMTFLYTYPAFGNYGVAIIMLVMVVRLVLHPLSKKSQMSMHKMKKLGPAMNKLKEKYADDKATLNKEMMKLGLNPLGPMLGCLPMFLQLPIWIALWTSIQMSVELRHAAFLPVWLTDLAGPDALFTLPFTIPFTSINLFNLLPILLCFAMALQFKLNPQMSGGGAATTPQAAQQQKMMKLLMPVMMLIFFYNAPSGLTLYIMASTFAGLLESRIIRSHIDKKEAQQAAAEVVVQGPGKTARDSRAKKPKGPFWMKGK